ncbi:hypothetical protein Q5P01_002470 [Channa striata]|uniref:C-type lectin domain-containing protein n=1 Tax=Channa striata TaxID=64152 RepID=A0AA88T4V1_CHASR|nr:hypothetical protein Q5P01_002470 [Channa striata]
MEWSLSLLVLMGQCSFITCQLYDYYFIKENKTWDEARMYCRKNYTDLATVSNMTDMKRLINSTYSEDEAWIGLHSYPGNETRTWHWSLPGVKFDESKKNWSSGEPNDNPFPQNCAIINKDLAWIDESCNKEHYFLCYNENRTSNNKVYCIKEQKTWPEAQNYCRVNHTDLVSGLDQLHVCDGCDQPGSYVWIGLFRDTWRWSDGSSFSFRYWESLSDNNMVDGQSKKTCATTVLNRAGRWSFDNCSNEKPFICYDDKVILINENKTWVEALNYCREKYHDLVSITSLDEQRWIQDRAKNASSPYVWLGLRYSCTLDFWFWVNDEKISYTNWSPNKTDECDMSAAMETGRKNQWVTKPDNEEHNFICF